MHLHRYQLLRAANDAFLAEGTRVLIEDPNRLDGVTAIGVDEHVWRYTRRATTHRDRRPDRDPQQDLPSTPAGPGPGPLEAGLQDLARRTPHRLARRRRGRRAPMSWTGSPGSRQPPPEDLPAAVAVMDPFPPGPPGRRRADQCRLRVQQAIHGDRGRKDDPIYRARRTLHTVPGSSPRAGAPARGPRRPRGSRRCREPGGSRPRRHPGS